MAFIVIEGIDRSGKSSVAEYYKNKGFTVVHMSAPDKKYSQPGYTGPSYLDYLVEQLMEYDGKDVVWDRSWFGELIWSKVYNRPPQLTEDDLEIIRDFEARNQTSRILMIDTDLRAHWARCVANKEPLTAPQFQVAHKLYSEMAHKYEFAIMTLPQFLKDHPQEKNEPATSKPIATNSAPAPSVNPAPAAPKVPKISTEQQVLEKANAINSILKTKRLFKQSGWPFDELESQVRGFLNDKLGELIGISKSDSLSKEDVAIVKEFVKRLKDKQGVK